MGRSGRRQSDIEAVSYKGLRCNKALDHGYVDQTERRSQSLDFKASLWIQLDRRPLVGGSNRGGIKAPSKPFPSFSKNRVFCSKLFQTKLWRFCEISRVYKDSNRQVRTSKFFSRRRSPFGRISAVAGPHSATERRRMGSRAFSGPRGSTEQLGRGAFMGQR